MVKARILIAAMLASSAINVCAQEVALFGQFNLGGKPLLERICPRITTGLLRGTIGPVKETCWTEKPFNHNGERAGFIELAHKETLPTWAEQARVSAIYVGQNLGHLSMDFDSRWRMEAMKSVAERFGNPSYADREHGTGWSRSDGQRQEGPGLTLTLHTLYACDVTATSSNPWNTSFRNGAHSSSRRLRRPEIG